MNSRNIFILSLLFIIGCEKFATKSNSYDDDLITGTDYIDCWVYIRGNETEEEHWDRLKKERN